VGCILTQPKTDLQAPEAYTIPPCKAGPERVRIIVIVVELALTCDTSQFVPTAALNDVNYEMHQCNISTWPPVSFDDSESSDSDSDARHPTDEHQHFHTDPAMRTSTEVAEVMDDQVSTLDKVSSYSIPNLTR
jgi:hypothetical protein